MKLLTLASLGTCLCYLGILAQPVQAGPIIFSDDFSENLDKWDAVRDNGAAWSVVAGKVRAVVNNPSTITELVPKDAFWRPDWQNLEYEIEITPLVGIDKNISFVFQNLSNWYELHFVEQFVQLARVKNGLVIMSLEFPYQMINGMTYRIKIQHLNGQVKLTINDQVVFDIEDWTFDQNFGKIGLKAGTGAAFPTVVEFDNVVVRLLDEIEDYLDIPLLKQSDVRWGAQEYDSALTWSQEPTIKRWGCALTSLVMVMRFHGITKLPDGQDITPGTVNNWLKQQPDGYLGEGNLNWLAATRLTKLVSDVYGTVKLEYRRHPGGELSVARAEISNQKPVIIQVPDHFLVGAGLTENENDLLIKDPDFEFDRLSQHQKAVISTSTFKPTQTDLSYILIVHKPGLQLKLSDAKGKNISGIQTYTQQLSADNQGESETTEPLVHHLLPTPKAGTYQIKINQPQLSDFEFQVMTYDRNGQPTIHRQTGVVGSRPKQWQLSIDTQKPSRLRRTSAFADLRYHLQLIHQNGGCRLWSLYWLLHQTMLNGERSKSSQQLKYLKALKLQLHMGRNFLSRPAYQYLEQELRDLENSP